MAIAVGASALVINKKGEILLTQRHDLRTWVFPGGMIAQNESPERAAIREAEEETGLKVKIVRLVAVYVNDHFLKKTINFFFLAEKIGGKPQRQKGEVLQIRWVKKQDAAKFLLPRFYQRFQDALATNQQIKLRTSHRFPIPLDKLPSYFWRRTLGKRLGLVKL